MWSVPEPLLRTSRIPPPAFLLALGPPLLPAFAPKLVPSPTASAVEPLGPASSSSSPSLWQPFTALAPMSRKPPSLSGESLPEAAQQQLRPPAATVFPMVAVTRKEFLASWDTTATPWVFKATLVPLKDGYYQRDGTWCCEMAREILSFL